MEKLLLLTMTTNKHPDQWERPKVKGKSILSSWRRDGLKQLAARQTNWLKQDYLVTVRYACLIQCFYHFQVPPGTSSPSSPSRLSSIR